MNYATRLRDLSRRATAGEWKAEQRSFGSPRYDGGPVIRAWDVRNEEGIPVAGGTIAIENPDNAALIVHLRNHAERLADLIEKCEALCHGDENDHTSTADIAAALAALGEGHDC